MKSQLYLWEGLRELKKKEIILYKDTFKEKIYPVFSNIEDEAERISNDIYENFMNSPCYCEEAFNEIQYISNVDLNVVSILGTASKEIFI